MTGDPAKMPEGAASDSVMAMAAKTTIAEVEEIVPVGSIGPEDVMTPAIFVHRIVQAKGIRYAG